MSRTIDESIEMYFEYMESVKNSITTLTSDNHLADFQQLACVGLLDTLAKCVANPRFNNYRRFTSFVENFCEWDECTNISLPHLVRFLQLVPSPEFERLREYAIAKLETWPQGQNQYLDSDPTYEEVLKLWPKDNEHKEPIEKVSLRSLNHLSLFWRLRNSIVHELQLPGYGMDGLVKEKPGYHSMTDMTKRKDKDPIETWELVYPITFVLQLVDSGISNLKMYCQKNKLNPYDYYKFGSYWIDELN